MYETTLPASRAMVIHPIMPLSRAAATAAAVTAAVSAAGSSAPGWSERDNAALLAEAVGLTAAISLQVVHSESVVLRKISAATLIGSGTIERLKSLVTSLEVQVVVVDGTVSPVQQRNLERDLSVKVIDRTGLILEIFGARARTFEGSLQVELAALSYQRSRLVRSWTHLERQRGGFGFLGGPGESQIEMDRRLIDERIVKLKRELEQVKRTRSLHRNARQKVPYPLVALVGYTNSGKSTLFNRLTGAEVFAENLLFATLDPTVRGMKLPSGRNIMLSDTVGFISNLPTELVMAFRATLEEVLEADVIIHVRDISHSDSAAQAADVEKVLRELGLGERVDQGLIEARNKIDLLTDGEKRALSLQNGKRQILLSAISGEGIETLLQLIDHELAAAHQVYRLILNIYDSKALAWLHQNGEVIDIAYSSDTAAESESQQDSVAVLVRLDDHHLHQFERQFSYLHKSLV